MTNVRCIEFKVPLPFWSFLPERTASIKTKIFSRSESFKESRFSKKMNIFTVSVLAGVGWEWG